MRTFTRPNYEELTQKIAALKQETPDISKRELYKSLKVSDYVLSRALEKLAGKAPRRAAMKAKANYEKVVVTAPTAETITVYVIKGDSASVLNMLKAMN